MVALFGVADGAAELSQRMILMSIKIAPRQ
jgi:hypothetical protein